MPIEHNEFYSVTWYESSLLRRDILHTVTGNKIVLDEIPDSLYGVQIKSNNSTVTMSENKFNEPITDSTQFQVNYSTGEVTVHQVLDGTTLNVVQYYARGYIKTQANRVSVKDIDDYFESSDAEGILQEIGSKLTNTTRNIFASYEDPTDGDGVAGDVWLKIIE